MGVGEIRQLYTREYSNTLYYCIAFRGEDCVPLFRRTKDPAKLAALADNWVHAVRNHAGAYLRHRLDFAGALLAVSGGAKEIYYLRGVPHHRLAALYPPPARAMRLLAWIDAHMRNLPFRPWVYAWISCFLLPMALLRYLRGGSPFPFLVALSGLAYLASVLITATSTDYRYSVWTILCTVLTSIMLGAPYVHRRRVAEPAQGPA
jgi:hypothetical protein